MEKVYLAVVTGEPREPAWSCRLAIGPAPGQFGRMRIDGKAGKPAETAFRVMASANGRTLLECRPVTGRTHQIRVHLAAIGHPILGDLLYGRDDDDFLEVARGARDPRRDEDGPTRHLLHCARLVAPDPAGDGTITIDAPLPEDLRAAIDDGQRVP